MSNVKVQIPFADRAIWIKRIDQRTLEAPGEALRLYDSELKRFNEMHWAVRWFIFKPPTRGWAIDRAYQNIGTLTLLKEMLETTGWETMSVDGWIFRWLSGANDDALPRTNSN